MATKVSSRRKLGKRSIAPTAPLSGTSVPSTSQDHITRPDSVMSDYPISIISRSEAQEDPYNALLPRMQSPPVTPQATARAREPTHVISPLRLPPWTIDVSQTMPLPVISEDGERVTEQPQQVPEGQAVVEETAPPTTPPKAPRRYDLRDFSTWDLTPESAKRPQVRRVVKLPPKAVVSNAPSTSTPTPSLALTGREKTNEQALASGNDGVITARSTVPATLLPPPACPAITPHFAPTKSSAAAPAAPVAPAVIQTTASQKIDGPLGDSTAAPSLYTCQPALSIPSSSKLDQDSAKAGLKSPSAVTNGADASNDDNSGTIEGLCRFINHLQKCQIVAREMFVLQGGDAGRFDEVMDCLAGAAGPRGRSVHDHLKVAPHGADKGKGRPTSCIPPPPPPPSGPL